MVRNALIRRLILTLALTGPAGCAGTEVEATGVATGGAPIDSYNIFYSALSPYGEWFWIDGFGDVWQPSVGVPAGWVFDAEWDWGWAPSHSGRWWLSPDHGWVWLPGRRGTPAWVRPGEPMPSRAHARTFSSPAAAKVRS
jgi:hypothetical protein